MSAKSYTLTGGYGCQHKTTKITYEKGSLILGKGSEMRQALNVDLEIDLDPPHNPVGDLRVVWTRGLEKVFPSLKHIQIPTIRFDWPDMGILEIPESFYAEIRSYILSGHSVAVFCQMGHGRTGTFACRLLNKGPKTLKWLRENYCKEVVETASQLEYLLEHKCAEANDKPAYHATTTTTKYGTDLYGGLNPDRALDQKKLKLPQLSEEEWYLHKLNARRKNKCHVTRGLCNYHYHGGFRDLGCGSDLPQGGQQAHMIARRKYFQNFNPTNGKEDKAAKKPPVKDKNGSLSQAYLNWLKQPDKTSWPFADEDIYYSQLPSSTTDKD